MELKTKSLPEEFYVSITGLKPKGFFGFILFWRYAIPSKVQADGAKGILYSGVKKINGIQHTLTVWESEAHMKAYIYSGIHLKAIKAFKKIATGKTFGFQSKSIPDWAEVHRLWQENGKDY